VARVAVRLPGRGDVARSYRIYVSSTYGDLKDHREHVYRTLRQLNHDVVAMEDYVATDQRPLERCLADVAASDLYVGVFAHRYGYIPDKGNPEERSITELEYRYAKALGKPCLVFLLEPEAYWPATSMDAITGDNKSGGRIRALREELGRDRLVSFFSTADELAQQVSVAVTNQLSRYGVGKPGQAAAGRSVPAQLPPDIADFTGRDKELAELRDRLAPAHDRRAHSSPTVVISAIAGKPGIGKSALTVHLAHQLQAEYSDGTLYVNLRGAEQEPLAPPLVLGQFLRALGVPDADVPTELNEQIARYRTLLAGRRMLVVLDNAADERQVRPLLPGSPTCVVLITSRNPLALEGTNPLSLELLEEGAARELLGKLAGKERVVAEPQAADAVSRYCGYLPLALRIVGAKLAARPAWSLATLAGRLKNERQRLAELSVGDLEVRASFALSYEALHPDDQRLFRLLGLLDGPDFTPGVVAALTDSSSEDTEPALERLTDAQLIETPSPGRYRFHDLLRLFAREQLNTEEPEQSRRAALERALTWYLQTTRHATKALAPARLQEEDPTSPFSSYAEALAWLEEERPNLVAAVRQASEQRWDDLAWQLAQTPWRFFNLRKYWPGDWQETLEFGLQAARRTGNRTAEGVMLHHLGYVLRDRHRFKDAALLLEESLVVFREVDDRYWEGVVLGTLGTLHRRQRQLDQAISYYNQSLLRRREVGNHQGEGQVLEALGRTYRQQQRFDEATRCLEQSLAIFQEIGDRSNEGGALSALAVVYLEQERFADAVMLLEQSSAIAREVGARYREGHNLAQLARAAVGLRRPRQEAEAYLQQSLAILREYGDYHAIGHALKNFGLIVERIQGHKAARHYWLEALDVLTPLHDPDVVTIQEWLEHPEQQKPWWSQWDP
jgi:tetratricopeptide (TPR) repeat protein